MPAPNRRQAQRSEAATARILEAALELYSTHGYGATSMREISRASGISVGNLYHHFSSKEEIFERLLEEYWRHVTDPSDELQQLFERGEFPDDLEELAAAIEGSVERHSRYILLIYIDVIEFSGRHIRTFYESMADRFAEVYGDKFAEMKRLGRFGDIDPLVAVMFATRWLFYYFLVENCFGVPMHFGMDKRQAVDEFIKILRYGVLPRTEPAGAGAAEARAPAQTT